MKFYSDDFYVKGPDEMERVFRAYPEAFANTARIAERVKTSLDTTGLHLPKFPVPKGMDASAYFEKVVRDGLQKRLSKPAHRKHELQEYHDRLEKEIEIIKSMGFPGYFLVVWDFIKYAKDNGIRIHV
jgi:DNA polymerase-3 subunit alpha